MQKMQWIIIDLHPVSNLDKSSDHGHVQAKESPQQSIRIRSWCLWNSQSQATDEWFNVDKFSLIQLKFYSPGI